MELFYGIVWDTHLSIVNPHLLVLSHDIVPYSRINYWTQPHFFSTVTILTLMQSINLIIVQIQPAQSMLRSKYHCSFWPRSWRHSIFCTSGSSYPLRSPCLHTLHVYLLHNMSCSYTLFAELWTCFAWKQNNIDQILGSFLEENGTISKLD